MSMVSSSSSSAIRESKHDVFLSFRGEDTRHSFTSHLYAALCGKQIVAFIDDEGLTRGDGISLALLKAIEESKLSVIIFSKNYASSTWCLDEVEKIIECKNMRGQIVVPIFYHVDPSDVRKQTGSFADAFLQHEERFTEMPERVQKWRAALTEAAGISGWDSAKMTPESKLVDEIVRDILKKLNNISPPMDSGERRLNELGYKQELRREMTLFKTLAISFSTMTLFAGITPSYGLTLLYAGPASLVWGWVVVSFFTWFVGIAMAEICSSFPTTGSVYVWTAHLAGPKWGPFASWCCAWLQTIALIAGIGIQAHAGSHTLQSIILLWTCTNIGGGYFAPKWLFLCVYIGLIIIWAVLNTYALEVIAFIDIISIWWQVVGGLFFVIILPGVALTKQPASYVFTHFEMSPEFTGISSKPYAVILSFLLSQYSLYGYDAAANLTEETKGANKNGPIAILSSIGIVSVFGWAYILALTFSVQDFSYLYDPHNETAGTDVPAQILYDAFNGRYDRSTGAIIFLFVIWGSFFFGGLSITTSAARVVYAFSRDKGIPFSSIWRQVHPKHKVPSNAVWLCAAICIILGLPILKSNVVFSAITSICSIGWMGGYAVPIFSRMVMAEKNFKAGPFYLGKASRPICLIAFSWICYTCSVFLLPHLYPIDRYTFNYAPLALGVSLGLIMLWWLLDARKWFKGPVKSIDNANGKV